MPSISGQSILVIGGTSGIGFAVAKLALKEDVRVTIASSNETKVNTAVDKLQSAFSQNQITGHVVKLGGEETEAQLDKLLIDVTASGPLDHVVYTAGSPVLRPFQEIDFKYVQESGRLGLSTPLLLAKLVPRYVKDGYTSSLILTGGQVGEKPYRGWTVYAAYASALYGMTRNLALDLAPIRVNLVSPGSTDTELWGEKRDQMREIVAESALLGKAGSAEEVAEAYIYAMKDTNATGVMISTSGGSLLK
jgi:NAD(P)-dependent dehydrogenase (short-subunit alcohol dehydrogenase family)